MLPLLLALSLAAAPQVRPEALPGAERVVFVPSLARLDGLVRVLKQAGKVAPSLAPSSWTDELHPLVRIDLEQPGAFSRVGIDPQGPATVSSRGALELTCTGLSDPARFTSIADEALREAGRSWHPPLDNARLEGAFKDGKVALGYVQVGRAACTARGPGSATALRQAAQSLQSGRWPLVGGWEAVPGSAVYYLQPDGVVGLAADGDTLELQGRGTPEKAWALPGAANTLPLAAAGLLRLHLRFPPKQAAKELVDLLRRQCHQDGAGGDEMRICQLDAGRLRDFLAANLSGELTLRAFEAEAPRSGKAGALDRLEGAAVLTITRPRVARALLSRVKISGAHRVEDGWVIPTSHGSLHVGISGHRLYVVKAGVPLAKALPELSSGSPARHAVEVALDPHQASELVGGISVVGLLSHPKLLPLLGLLPPLKQVLDASERFDVWADPDGEQVRFGGHWVLRGGP